MPSLKKLLCALSLSLSVLPAVQSAAAQAPLPQSVQPQPAQSGASQPGPQSDPAPTSSLLTTLTGPVAGQRLPGPGLPQVNNAGPVRGPVAWKVKPAATVAHFIGWLPTITPAGTSSELPVRTYLDGLAFDYQTYNNCGPSALSSVFGYFGVQVGQDAVRQATRRSGGYMQVSAIAPQLAKFDLHTTTLRNGQLHQVKRLLALGIPVIVLQWYDRVGHIPHFRVVRGYDDQAGLFWVSDSMVGPIAYLSYRDFDALWNTQGRQMFPVYPSSYELQVQSL